MPHPEFYLPGTSDNPKTGHKPATDKRSGEDYLMPKNPFVEGAGLFHGETHNPEDILIDLEESEDDAIADSHTPPEFSEDVPRYNFDTETGMDEEGGMSFLPIEDIQPANVDRRVKPANVGSGMARAMVNKEQEKTWSEFAHDPKKRIAKLMEKAKRVEREHAVRTGRKKAA